MTDIKTARLLRRALRENWMNDVFPVNAPEDDLKEYIQNRASGANAVEKAVAATHVLLSSGDPRSMGIAAKVVVDMVKANTEQERFDAGELRVEGGQHVHFHQHGSEVANGTGLHSAERIERLRSKIAERDRTSGVGATSGD